MAFRLRTAVTDGLRLTFSRNGAVFVGCNAVAQFVSLMLLAVAVSQQLPVSSGIGAAPLADVPATQPLPTAATGVTVGLTTVFSAIVTTPITIITIRTFVDGATDRILERHLYGQLGRATARGLVASLVFGVVIFIGFLCAFLLPVALGIGVMIGVGQIGFLPDWIGVAGMVLIGAIGFIGVVAAALLLYIHLMFVLHEISVRNRSVITSLRGSWGLVRGHRLRLGVLSVGVIGVQSAINSIATPNQLSDPTTAEALRTSVSQLVFLPVGVVLTAFVTTLSAAIVARAYAELTTVDVVGGHPRDIDTGDDQLDRQAGVDTDGTDVDTEPAP
ncbi:hypothetical protein [Halonotius pteroides]|nr:hypothetical protein [Halonotius pteroides]